MAAQLLAAQHHNKELQRRLEETIDASHQQVLRVQSQCQEIKAERESLANQLQALKESMVQRTVYNELSSINAHLEEETAALRNEAVKNKVHLSACARCCWLIDGVEGTSESTKRTDASGSRGSATDGRSGGD